jgi:hypothetical protein
LCQIARVIFKPPPFSVETMIFFRRKGDREKNDLGEDPIIIGVFSGEIGAGVSSIASSLCLLFSCLGYGCVFIDMDVFGAVSSRMIFHRGLASKADSLYAEDAARNNASLLHIIARGGKAVSLLDPGVSGISLSGGRTLPSQRLYVLPGRLLTEDLRLFTPPDRCDSETHKILLRSVVDVDRAFSERVYGEAVRLAVMGAREAALREGVRYIVIDSIPMPRGEEYFCGHREMVSAAIESVDRALLAASSDSGARGLDEVLRLVRKRYRAMMRKIDAMIINKAFDDEEKERIIETARRNGVERIYFIRYDPDWSSTTTVPIARAVSGASEDLIGIALSLGYISKKDLEALDAEL